MKVILISAVSGLGNVGDVVDVKNGYGRNFLIPNKKAIIFNENNNKFFEGKRKHFEEENQKSIAAANVVKKSIGSTNIVITENASDDGRLYGSVNSTTISDRINKIIKQELIAKSNIILKNPIKEIGVYEATVSLHHEAEFNVVVVVCRNESEVESLLKAKKEAEKSEKQKSEDEIAANSKSEKPKSESDSKEQSEVATQDQSDATAEIAEGKVSEEEASN